MKTSTICCLLFREFQLCTFKNWGQGFNVDERDKVMQMPCEILGSREHYFLFSQALLREKCSHFCSVRKQFAPRAKSIWNGLISAAADLHLENLLIYNHTINEERQTGWPKAVSHSHPLTGFQSSPPCMSVFQHLPHHFGLELTLPPLLSIFVSLFSYPWRVSIFICGISWTATESRWSLSWSLFFWV